MLNVEFSVNFMHRLRFTQGCFDPSNQVLVDLLERFQDRPVSALVFLDENVDRCFPTLMAQIERYAELHADKFKLAGSITRVPGGEALKNNSRNLEPILAAIDRAQLCRRSYIIAVGGGAVLDTVGFAAAMCHRGIRLIRVATTTLSHADSVVGVKNGINAYGKKNYLGVFSCPWAVINDENFLSSLSDANWRCGFSEVVKVALLKDPQFFEFIEMHTHDIRRRNMKISMPIIRRSAEMHFNHIVKGGDPFELTHSRPLDFGHWAAHKLEHMSDFELSHGDAVAIGLALDVTYAALRGRLSKENRSRVLNCLKNLGFSLYHPALLKTDEILKGLNEFREHLGGQLTIPFITDIGQPVDVHKINPSFMKKAINELVLRYRRTSPVNQLKIIHPDSTASAYFASPKRLMKNPRVRNSSRFLRPQALNKKITT